MEFVVSRDPLLPFHKLLPSLFQKALPCPVEGRETTYHYWARNALYHGLKFLGLSPGDKVLVPAFHCRTVVEPVLQYGCRVVFYNVHRDGTVDFHDLEKKTEGDAKALIAIHYFGILQPVYKLQEFCRQHDLLLIEDCAHVLCGEINGEPIGSFGHVSIFSWRKFFPLNDGGLLVRNSEFPRASVNWKRLDVWSQMKNVKNLLERALEDRKRQGSSHVQQSRAQSSLPEISMHEDVSMDNQTSGQHQPAEFDYAQVDWPMSHLAKVILKNMDLPSIVQKRIENNRDLFQAMSGLSEIETWLEGGETSLCTWAFPILVPSRRDVHIQLRKKGVQAFSWDGVIHPALPVEQFPDAKFLYEHLVLLPNQQSLAQDDLHFMVDEIKQVLSDGVHTQQVVC